MKKEIVKFLEANQSNLISDWKKNLSAKWTSQVSAASLSGGSGGSRIPASCSSFLQTEEMVAILIAGFYNDLLTLAHGRSLFEMERFEQRFPHYSPYGGRLTLPYFMEIFFAGEDVFAKHLLQNGVEKYGFTSAEAVEAFEEIDQVLHDLTQHYAETFCKECLAPLTDTIHRVMEGGRACKKCQWSFYEKKL